MLETNPKMNLSIYAKILFFWIGIFCSPFVGTTQNNLIPEVKKIIKNWEYFHQKKDYDLAIEQTHQAFNLAKKINNKELMGVALNREGQSLIKKTKRVNRSRRVAKEKFEQSLFYLTNIEDTDLKISNLNGLRWLAERDGDLEEAIVYESQIKEIKDLLATAAINEKLTKNNEKLAQNNEKLEENNELLAENKGLLEEKVDRLAVQKLQLSKKVKSLTAAQLEAELLIALQKNQVDSLSFETIKDSLLLEKKELVVAEQASKLELQQSHIQLQDSQIELQASQRNFFFALAGIIGLLAIGAFLRYMETKKHFTILATKNEIIEEERKKSEQLLLNILPAVIANELKVNGVAKARKYENATVLFSDFKNFSAIAETLTPERLVSELDFYFKTFDEIIGKYNLEKIKTIGDAYMCVGGLPEERAGHSLDVVRAALEIQSYLNAWKLEKEGTGEPYFEARMGIHTGPLIAGVVGSKKFAYDIWGDTVNVAARLETNSEAGKVNISATTFDLIKTQFDCEFRGKIPIKNRGEIDMYFVNGVN